VADHYRHNAGSGPNVCDVRCRHFEGRASTHPISLGSWQRKRLASASRLRWLDTSAPEAEPRPERSRSL